MLHRLVPRRAPRLAQRLAVAAAVLATAFLVLYGPPTQGAGTVQAVAGAGR